jgi:signal transduction histidine kinase
VKINHSFCWLCILLFCQKPFAQTNQSIDSAREIASKQSKNAVEFIKTSFFIADCYMDLNQYDSAQHWLSTIHVLLPSNAVSVDSYLLLTRQSEVYYYNNLHQLGLQESRRSLAIAQALNDSVYLANSYNFLGLFYMNIDSVATAVDAFNSGLRFSQQTSNEPKHYGMSKPYHLHGNLAEAYYKLNQLDNAAKHYRLSLQKATTSPWPRAIALAQYGLGEVFFLKGQIDSAFLYYDLGAKLAQKSKHPDVVLLSYAGLANCFASAKKWKVAFERLDTCLNIIQQTPYINRYYLLNFLNRATEVYKKGNNTKGLIAAMQLKSNIEGEIISGNNSQVQAVLNAGIENEKRVLQLQIEEAERKRELANSRLLIALGGIALLGIVFLVYRYYLNQKLAVVKLRHKISQDLHDDIGASLSSLQIFGAIAEQSIHKDANKAVEMLHKISSQSRVIMENMGDIVWSMKNDHSTGTSIETKIKNFAAELLVNSNIDFKCSIASNADQLLTGITARRNLYLIAKEAMNNIVKYSKAKTVNLSLQVEQQQLVLAIMDDGMGFNPAAITRGNGLGNMQQRTRELNGGFEIAARVDGGTMIRATFPLEAIT